MNSPLLTKEVSKWLLSSYKNIKEVKAISPDGSTRSFFRIFTSESSYILLYDPKFSADYPAHQKYLSSLGLNVPNFFAINENLGCILMEDLGNELLQSRIQHEPKIPWLKEAVTVLSRLHSSSYPFNLDIPASKRFFDQAKFKEELLFTFEHFVEKFLNLNMISKSTLEKLSFFCEKISKIFPKTFSHRDYHTRNIMVHKNSLYMIDFQDARTGPIHYDLASLIFDSYVPLETEERNILCEHYKNNIINSNLGKETNWNLFENDLFLIALQRVVKAIGSFASFYTRYKKSTHLKYILPALNICSEILNRKNMENYKEIFQVDIWTKKAQNHPLIESFSVKIK